MGIARCSNGHFYDDELHSECPYCSNNPNATFMDRSTVALKQQGDNTTAANNNYEVAAHSNNSAATVHKDIMQNDIHEQKTVAKRNAVNGSSINEQRTVAKRNIESKTQGIVMKNLGMDPVVGWLVCIDGPDRGRDFRLHSGRSQIGRSSVMDIALTKDMTIASQNHASIVYEPRKNKFFLVSVSGSNAYVNGEPALDVMELNNYDEIIIGETKLHFVAYCKGDIKWEKR